jgi:hypothetical protein
MRTSNVRFRVKFYLAGVLLLLAAAPAAEPNSPKAQCKTRCSTMYSFCLKRTTTSKGRAQCKMQRATCRGGCGK